MIDLIKAKVRDSSGDLQESDYAASLAEALKRYSRHRPRLVCEDLPGTGTHDLVLPSGWSDGVSVVVSVEYPVGTVPESLLDPADWAIYQSPSGLSLRLIYVAPALTEAVRLLYSALHTEATIPMADQEALVNLAASICLRQLAARYGQTSDPTIGADVVNYRSKCDEFRRLADSLEEQYNNHLGIGTHPPVSAAMVSAKPAASSRTRLTHR